MTANGRSRDLALAARLLVTLASMAVGWQTSQAGESRFEFTEVHMGMDFRLVFYAPDAQLANRAATAVWQRIATLDSSLSDYRADSELMRLVHQAGPEHAVTASDDLWNVLQRSQQIARDSGGAFDVTVGPLVRLWRRARRQHELPDRELLASARSAVGYQALLLDETTHSVRLMRPEMRLDLGGIAVGYTVDEALGILRAHGITRALVDGSGDIVAGGPPPGEAGWRIGIQPLEGTSEAAGPRSMSRFVRIVNQSVSTSGDLYQFVEIGGKRYSHIIDPRIGEPLTVRRSVTIVACDGITADALATAVSVLGAEKGLALVECTTGAAGLVVEGLGPEQLTSVSSRWKDDQ